MHSGPIVWSERESSSWQETRGRYAVGWLAVVIALSACLITLAISLAAWQAGGAPTLLG